MTSRATNFLSTIALAAGALTAVPSGAAAQASATSFDDLRFLLKAGDVIFVTEATGPERRATVVGLAPSSLSVEIDGARRLFPDGSLTRIRRTRADPLGEGGTLGAAAGIGLGAAVSGLNSPPCSDVYCRLGPMLLLGGLGALVGMGIDAAVQGRTVIYSRTPNVRLRLTPSIGSPSPVMALSIDF